MSTTSPELHIDGMEMGNTPPTPDKENLGGRALEFVGRKLNEAADSIESSFTKAGEVVKNWVSDKWEKLKTVSKEWVTDVADTIKLGTIDKFNYLRSKDNTNNLIQLKENEMVDLGYQAENERRKAGTFTASKDAEVGKFNAALESMQDEVLSEIFKRNRDEKEIEWNTKIDLAESTATQCDLAREKNREEIETFKSEIESAGEGFSQKIDAKIGRIYEQAGYNEKKEQVEVLSEQIGNAEESLVTVSKNIETYNNALATAKELGVAASDIERVRLKLNELKDEKQKTEDSIQRARSAQIKLQAKIKQIDVKAQKWESLKDKLGLSKKTQSSDEVLVDSPIIEEPEDEEVDVVEEPSIDSSDTPSAEEAVEMEHPEDLKQEFEPEGQPKDEEQEAVFESVEDSSESKEEMKQQLSKYFSDLYKYIGMVTPTGAQILDKLKESKPLMDEATELLGEDVGALADSINAVLSKYSAVEEIEPFKDQLKKDVLNRIIRKVPESIEL